MIAASLFPLLPLCEVSRWLETAQREDVTESKATAEFLKIFFLHQGRPKDVSWLRRRADHLRKQMLLATSKNETLFVLPKAAGEHERPSRRHLGMIMWGFSPQPKRLKAARP